MSDNKIIEVVPEDHPSKPGKSQKRHSLSRTQMNVISVAAVIGTFAVSCILGIFLFKGQYKAAKKSTAAVVRETTYEIAYSAAEASSHVGNRVAISIGDIQSLSRLEVLQVADIEYSVVNSTENPESIDSWLEVPGSGVCTVDLTMSEIIVDNEHQRILVRVPVPVLTDFSIDYANVKRLLYKNDIWNDSVSVGEEYARKQLKEAYNGLKDELAGNQAFFLSAKKSAITILTNLLTNLNPNAEGLKIDIEFIN